MAPVVYHTLQFSHLFRAIQVEYSIMRLSFCKWCRLPKLATHSLRPCALNFTLRQTFEFRAPVYNKGKLPAVLHTNMPCVPRFVQQVPPRHFAATHGYDDHAPKTARIQMTLYYYCNGDGCRGGILKAFQGPSLTMTAKKCHCS